MLGLTLRVGMGNQRARLAQAKAQLSEQPLALPYPQGNSVLLDHPSRQGLSVPDLSRQAKFLRTPPESASDLLKLLGTESPWSPRPLSIHQTRQAFGLEAMDPRLDGPWGIAKQMARFTATHTLGHQQHPVQAVVVSCPLGTANLILQSEDQSLSIRNSEFSHAERISGVADMRNYL
jgi:hypothetical protein